MTTALDANTLIDLDNDESILMEVRRHPIVFYARLLILVVLFFIPLFISPFVVLLIDKVAGNAVGALVFGFLFTLWCLVLFVSFFYQWTDYYLDVWIITTKRIFDIDQKGFFRREISVCRIEQLQDVSIIVDGLIATFFKFGTIHIHTAGESHDFLIKDARNPMSVKNIIMQAHGKTIDSPVITPMFPEERA